MSDKVQKIKEETERLKNHTLNVQKSTNGLITSVGRGRVEAFNDILSFIDSLPEEPVSEDLEEYAKKLTKGAALDKHNLIWMCKKGAEWQKQQYEKLFSKDSWTYIEENYPDISQEEKLKLYDISIKSRLAGAECQKQKDFEELLKSDMSKFKECYEKGKADAMKEIMKDASSR